MSRCRRRSSTCCASCGAISTARSCSSRMISAWSPSSATGSSSSMPARWWRRAAVRDDLPPPRSIPIRGSCSIATRRGSTRSRRDAADDPRRRAGPACSRPRLRLPPALPRAPKAAAGSRRRAGTPVAAHARARCHFAGERRMTDAPLLASRRPGRAVPRSPDRSGRWLAGAAQPLHRRGARRLPRPGRGRTLALVGESGSGKTTLAAPSLGLAPVHARHGCASRARRTLGRRGRAPGAATGAKPPSCSRTRLPR